MSRFNPFIRHISTTLYITLDSNGDIETIELDQLKKFIKNKNNPDDSDFIALTDRELNKIGYKGQTYTLTDSETGISKKYKTSKSYFTIKEVFDNLLDFETDNRPYLEWDDGIDQHHVYFEGFYRINHQCYEIFWGS